MKFFMYVFLCWTCFAVFCTEKSLPVTAIRIVPVYAAPDCSGNPIGQIPQGCKVFPAEMNSMGYGQTIRIRLPYEIPVWIHKKDLTSDMFAVKGADLRCGPGLVFARIGSADGTKVEFVSSSARGFWCRVKTSSPSYAYVEKSALLPDHSVNSKPQTLFDQAFSEQTSIIGTIMKLPEPQDGISYALGARTGLRLNMICYLTGDESLLKGWVGRVVKVSGTQSWKKGLNRPYVKVSRIEPSVLR